LFLGAKPLKSPPWRRDCSSHPAFLLSTMMGKTSEFQTHFVTWVSSLTDSSTSLSMSTLVLHRGIKTANILKVAAGRKAEERHLVMLYKSLVLSVVDYALPMINISQNLMGKLERLQNECLHIITGCPSSAPVHVLQYWSWTFLNRDTTETCTALQESRHGLRGVISKELTALQAAQQNTLALPHL